MMLLLDTNVIYRWLMDQPLPADVVQQVHDQGATVSVLAPWEMLIKHQLGKLALPTTDPASDIAARGFQILPIRSEHLRYLSELPMLHRDPFDRLLLAQAKADGYRIVTTDALFADYLPNTWVVTK